MAITPATIRYKNPGAMYPGKSSRKFGSRDYGVIGGGHKIARFATSREGAAALFDLLDRVYVGMSVGDAIAKWSGGNNVNSYLSVIERKTSLSRHDYLDRELIRTAQSAIPFAKAMAQHETGKAYPLSDIEWEEAHAVFVAKIEGEQPDIMPTSPYGGPQTAALEYARTKLGEKEIPGDANNPFIMQCYEDVGYTNILHDEVPWCAAFAGHCLRNVGMKHLPTLMARDYLRYGIELREPEEGAVVVFWRKHPESWTGHVAFVEKWTDKTVTVIGGNQSDAVTRETLPRIGEKSKVLGYRRPISAVAPVREIVDSESVKYKATGLFGLVMAGLSGFADYVVKGVSEGVRYFGELVGAFPEASSQAVYAVKSSEALVKVTGLPWPVYAGLGIAGTAIIFNLVKTFHRKRYRLEIDQ